MVKPLATLLTERKPTGTLKTNPRYARVFFAVRKRFRLSAAECLLADMIAILSRKSGWCFASRAYLADLLGVSTRTLQRMLTTLKARGLIEQHTQDPRRLRPSEQWKHVSDTVSDAPG